MNQYIYCCNRAGLFGSLVLILLGAACSQPAPPPQVQTENNTDASVVLYAEQEAGTGTYPVRILVNPGYVRLDDGYDESDFVLFDRHSRTIFSIVHDTHSVLEIVNHPFNDTMPADLMMTEERIRDDDAPEIAGRQPVHTRYLANGTSCYQAVSIPGLLGEAVAGMAEYASALGERQLANMQSVPEAMRTPCFLSRYMYVPGRHYTHGLPVQIWDESGPYRSLTDFSDKEPVASALFEVPANYEKMRLGQ